MAPKIDHIIIRVPYSDLAHPPEWLTQNFTISAGGRHADNKTENRLIIFRDGSYIELIAFIDDDETLRKGHWWGEHDFGIMDWALTSSSADDVVALGEQLSTAAGGIAKYAEPQEGGRKRPDGVELKWKVTFPEGVRRGEVPFFCHDVTARELRVPTDEISTTHPCGALGIGSITLATPEPKYEGFKKFYATLLGSEGTSNSYGTLWEIEAPVKDVMLVKPTVTVETAEDPDARHAFVSDLTLLTDTIGLGQSRTTLAETLGGQDIFVNFVHGKSA